MSDHENKPGELPDGHDLANPATAPEGSASKPSNVYTGQPDDLHDLFGAHDNFNATDDEDPLAALRNDPNYAQLIKELEYIASQARLLFEPAQEAPSDEVWTKIQSKLKEEPE